MANSATAKASVGFSSIDLKALKAESNNLGGTVTLRHSRDDLLLKLAVNEATLKDVQSMTGAVASAEYNLNAETIVKAAYGEAPRPGGIARRAGACGGPR
jgi:hypothetical protein